MSRILYLSIYAVCAVAIVTSGFGSAMAQEGNEELDAINRQIQDKQQVVDQLEKQIDSYRVKIDTAQAAKASLNSQIDLLENRMAKTQLDIEASEASIDLTNAQLAAIEREIRAVQEEYDINRAFIADVLRQMQAQDNRLPLLLLFGTDSFSELFDTLYQLEDVSGELTSAVERARDTKTRLVEKRSNEQSKKEKLVVFGEALERERERLQAEADSKELLVAQTKQSEAQFQTLLREVQEEQEYINYQVTLLQRELEKRLGDGDAQGGNSLLSWPIDPSIKGISATFHDPSYPFRNLFEHSGVDLPASTGTPVSAAAPGYVAWTKTGRMYGNYVMVIHANGISTLYAHLSRIDVVADQFVGRGDTIGAVGSTGFSTGPHLHLEVRLNGIPTNPLPYLMSY